MTTTLECGHKLPVDNRTGVGTGYATLPDGTRVCYDCADVLQREDMRTAAVVVGYLSAGISNRSITTWTGGHLATVTSYHESKRARKCYVQATDTHGQRWHGTGPLESGTYVTLHRSKG